MTTLEIQLSQVWGNDDETQAFTHFYDEEGSCLVFRDSRTVALPLSLENRIVACFHELLVASFEDGGATHMALNDAACQEWSNLVNAAWVSNAIVDLYGGQEGQADWHTLYESTLHQNYL